MAMGRQESQMIMSRLSPFVFFALLAALGPAQAAPVSVHIIAFNDFHGALQPPRQAVLAPAPGGATVRVPAGGAAYLASAIDGLRAANANNVVVAAGDLIGASPLVSALFLDEPSIEVLNMMHLEYSALGNHEFDKGKAELQRMQRGGCAVLTVRKPCAFDGSFQGAHFSYLAANTLTEDGKPLFPAYAIKGFGTGVNRVMIGFIGLTLRSAPTIVTPAGVAGLRFTDEADAANALVPVLRRAGADVIVVLIHQGGETTGTYDDKACPGLTGDILPILDRLDPAIGLVVSGHTHRAYVCEYGPSHIVLTSAGNNGTVLTDIALSIDPATHKVIARQADNSIVQGEGYAGTPITDLYPKVAPSAPVAILVGRYAAAVAPLASRPAGALTGPATRAELPTHETVLGDLVADAQLAATRAPDRGGAQVAFMNPGGLRADLVPAADGAITYGQIFAVQPFGNTSIVKTMTGRQIIDLLEQQFDGGPHTIQNPKLLQPSATLHYAYDLSRPRGSRIIDPRIDGVPVDLGKSYRVTMNSFLASGGDDFTIFRDGTDPFVGAADVDALESYLIAAGRLTPPAGDRVRSLTPTPQLPVTHPERGAGG
jgi:5'-nucleotidase